MPVLVFGYGNPSRGDDALGVALIRRLGERQASGELLDVELLTDFQLQPEHALDLARRELVILVDADASLGTTHRLEPLTTDQAASYTTHEMSPGALLWVYDRIGLGPPPPCYLLRIRGYHFDLGSPLSPAARHNLDLAETCLLSRLAAQPGPEAQVTPFAPHTLPG
jgi:hydrogenase maturation protease